MQKEWDSFEYKIAGHFLSALINGDESGLDSREQDEFYAFILDANDAAKRNGFTIGHWDCEDGESDDWGVCEVTGLFAMRQTVKLMVYRDLP